MEVRDVKVTGIGKAPHEVRSAAIKRATRYLAGVRGKEAVTEKEVFAHALMLLAFALACGELLKEVGAATYGLVDADIVDTEEDGFPVCVMSIGINPEDTDGLVCDVTLDDDHADLAAALTGRRAT